MELCVTPAKTTLGATVTGVDLANLDDKSFRAIEAAFHEHAVLVFPGQDLADEAQTAFGARFGPLSIKAQPFSNEREDGSLRDIDDPLMKLLLGNEGWHTDSSFQPISAKASILSARKVPSTGGETEWADMRAAYDALPSARRREISELKAYHSLFHSQSVIGRETDTTAAGLAALHAQRTEATASDSAGYREPPGPPPLRPLVKVHPVTARPALYIGRHAYGIPGLDEAQSAALLDELLAFACQPPRVFQHRWRVGDLVMWDNRCVLHRARPWSDTEPRVMFHTRVDGDPVTEAAA